MCILLEAPREGASSSRGLVGEVAKVHAFLVQGESEGNFRFPMDRSENEWERLFVDATTKNQAFTVNQKLTFLKESMESASKTVTKLFSKASHKVTVFLKAPHLDPAPFSAFDDRSTALVLSGTSPDMLNEAFFAANTVSRGHRVGPRFLGASFTPHGPRVAMLEVAPLLKSLTRESLWNNNMFVLERNASSDSSERTISDESRRRKVVRALMFSHAAAAVSRMHVVGAAHLDAHLGNIAICRGAGETERIPTMFDFGRSVPLELAEFSARTRTGIVNAMIPSHTDLPLESGRFPARFELHRSAEWLSKMASFVSRVGQVIRTAAAGSIKSACLEEVRSRLRKMRARVGRALAQEARAGEPLPSTAEKQGTLCKALHDDVKALTSLFSKAGSSGPLVAVASPFSGSTSYGRWNSQFVVGDAGRPLNLTKKPHERAARDCWRMDAVDLILADTATLLLRIFMDPVNRFMSNAAHLVPEGKRKDVPSTFELSRAIFAWLSAESAGAAEAAQKAIPAVFGCLTSEMRVNVRREHTKSFDRCAKGGKRVIMKITTLFDEERGARDQSFEDAGDEDFVHFDDPKVARTRAAASASILARVLAKFAIDKAMDEDVPFPGALRVGFSHEKEKWIGSNLVGAKGETVSLPWERKRGALRRAARSFAAFMGASGSARPAVDKPCLGDATIFEEVALAALELCKEAVASGPSNLPFRDLRRALDLVTRAVKSPPFVHLSADEKTARICTPSFARLCLRALTASGGELAFARACPHLMDAVRAAHSVLMGRFADRIVKSKALQKSSGSGEVARIVCATSAVVAHVVGSLFCGTSCFESVFASQDEAVRAVRSKVGDANDVLGSMDELRRCGVRVAALCTAVSAMLSESGMSALRTCAAVMCPVAMAEDAGAAKGLWEWDVRSAVWEPSKSRARRLGAEFGRPVTVSRRDATVQDRFLERHTPVAVLLASRLAGDVAVLDAESLRFARLKHEFLFGGAVDALDLLKAEDERSAFRRMSEAGPRALLELTVSRMERFRERFGNKAFIGGALLAAGATAMGVRYAPEIQRTLGGVAAPAASAASAAGAALGAVGGAAGSALSTVSSGAAAAWGGAGAVGAAASGWILPVAMAAGVPGEGWGGGAAARSAAEDPLNAAFARQEPSFPEFRAEGGVPRQAVELEPLSEEQSMDIDGGDGEFGGGGEGFGGDGEFGGGGGFGGGELSLEDSPAFQELGEDLVRRNPERARLFNHHFESEVGRLTRMGRVPLSDEMRSKALSTAVLRSAAEVALGYDGQDFGSLREMDAYVADKLGDTHAWYLLGREAVLTDPWRAEMFNDMFEVRDEFSDMADADFAEMVDRTVQAHLRRDGHPLGVEVPLPLLRRALERMG